MTNSGVTDPDHDRDDTGLPGSVRADHLDRAEQTDHAGHAGHTDHRDRHTVEENEAGEYVTDNEETNTTDLGSGSYVSDGRATRRTEGVEQEAANFVAPVDHGDGAIDEKRDAEEEGGYTDVDRPDGV